MKIEVGPYLVIGGKIVTPSSLLYITYEQVPMINIQIKEKPIEGEYAKLMS